MRFTGATHLVVLAQREEPGIASFLESTLMEWLDLAINREKTRTVHLKAEKASLDFLGFTLESRQVLYNGSPLPQCVSVQEGAAT